MAAKKKTKKKHTKLKKTAAKKGRPIRKKAPKKSLKKKRAVKKTAGKTKAPVKKRAGAKTKGAVEKRVLRARRKVDTKSFAPQGRRPRPVPQSGDLQGISNVEAADSESVGELIEEGNAFEADVVMGVEEAGERSNREVHTREVPEDDVPGEYLDKE
jgi:hypothetical protein